jgi:hypothetical protein
MSTTATADERRAAQPRRRDVAMMTHDHTGEGDYRARSQAQERSSARAAVSGLAVRLEALRAMTTQELRAEYRRLFGEPSHSRNRTYLRKKLAYRIQEIEEGGPPQKARDRIEHLLGLESAVRVGPRPVLPALADDAPAPEGDAVQRDPRLPPPGTVLRRKFGGEEHLVEVVEGGFMYRGQLFTSLSTLAMTIAGTVWNGFSFFRASLQAARPAPTAKPRSPR